MCQWIRGWKCLVVAAVCGVFVSATVVLASAAPAFAATLHGGAHGRANVLVHSGPIVPLHGMDLVALGVAAAVACVAVVIDRRYAARQAPPVRHFGRRSTQTDQGTSRRRAA
jgi:hypothetical protein